MRFLRVFEVYARGLFKPEQAEDFPRMLDETFLIGADSIDQACALGREAIRSQRQAAYLPAGKWTSVEVKSVTEKQVVLVPGVEAAP